MRFSFSHLCGERDGLMFQPRLKVVADEAAPAPAPAAPKKKKKAPALPLPEDMQENIIPGIAKASVPIARACVAPAVLTNLSTFKLSDTSKLYKSSNLSGSHAARRPPADPIAEDHLHPLNKCALRLASIRSSGSSAPQWLNDENNTSINLRSCYTVEAFGRPHAIRITSKGRLSAYMHHVLITLTRTLVMCVRSFKNGSVPYNFWAYFPDGSLVGTVSLESRRLVRGSSKISRLTGHNSCTSSGKSMLLLEQELLLDIQFRIRTYNPKAIYAGCFVPFMHAATPTSWSEKATMMAMIAFLFIERCIFHLGQLSRNLKLQH
eukprot:1176524-Prorocentrum_minimum.AAC.3